MPKDTTSSGPDPQPTTHVPTVYVQKQISLPEVVLFKYRLVVEISTKSRLNNKPLQTRSMTAHDDKRVHCEGEVEM